MFNAFRVSQRVKFIDPDSFDPRIGQGYEVRGRITYIDGDLMQVIQDGKTFAIWMKSPALLPE